MHSPFVRFLNLLFPHPPLLQGQRQQADPDGGWVGIPWVTPAHHSIPAFLGASSVLIICNSREFKPPYTLVASPGLPKFVASKWKSRPGGGVNPQNDSGSPIMYLLMSSWARDTQTHRAGGGGEKKGGLSKSGRWLIVAETLAPQGVVWA